jgi:hypothetical protein
MVLLANNISAQKNSRREVGAPAQRLQAAVEQLTGGHSTPTLDFFRAISAGECLVVSTVTLCGAKLNSLTPLGSANRSSLAASGFWLLASWSPSRASPAAKISGPAAQSMGDGSAQRDHPSSLQAGRGSR